MLEIHHFKRTAASTPKAPKKRRRRNQGLLCGVCGLPAKSNHFGGPACETCKVFFRRAVQKGTCFVCTRGGQCPVSHLIYDKCWACRFVKCLKIGMNPKWVMTPEERKKRREYILNNQVHRIHRMYDPDPQDLLDLLTDDEIATVRTAVLRFKDIASNISLQDVAEDISNTIDANGHNVWHFAVAMMFTMRVLRFACELPEFARLQPATRQMLIGNALPQMYSLRSTYEFETNDYAHQYAEIHFEDYIKRKMSAAWLRKFFTYSENLHKLAMDEPCLVLLMLVTLFSAEILADQTEADEVETLQERFLSILSKYVRWKYGSLNCSTVFPKLLGLLTETHGVSKPTEKDYWMDSFEWEYTERRLREVNPICEYSLERRNELFIPAAVDPCGVLEDETPTIDMIRRGAASIYLSTVQETDSSCDSSDLFSLIEELHDLKSPEEISSECNHNNSNISPVHTTFPCAGDTRAVMADVFTLH